MSSIDRATIKIGPANVTHDGVTHFFGDGLTLTVSKIFVDIEVDAFGVMLKAHTDTTIEVSGTPKAWTGLAKLNPFGPMVHGQLLCGAVDKPLVITPVNGKPLTLAAACVRTPPNLMLSANKPMFSSACTWAGVLANATAWSAVGARYTYGADASGVALTGLTPAQMGFCTWSATLGGVAIPDHEDGIAITFSPALTEQRGDSVGLVDWSFDGMEVTVGYVPLGVNESDNLDALALQGAGAARGKSAAAQDLVVTGSIAGRSFSLKGCVRRTAASRYSRSLKRVGEVELVSTRSATAGALDPLYTFGEAA